MPTMPSRLPHSLRPHLQVGVQRLDEREYQLEIRTNAVEHQQGWQVTGARANGRSQELAVKLDGTKYKGLWHVAISFSRS